MKHQHKEQRTAECPLKKKKRTTTAYFFSVHVAAVAIDDRLTISGDVQDVPCRAS